MLTQELPKNKFATQGWFNKMKAKIHKEMTPYPYVKNPSKKFIKLFIKYRAYVKLN